MQGCLSYFGELTEAQQLQAAYMFKYRINKDIKHPSALLTSVAASVQSASKSSGLKRPTPSATNPYMPGKPKNSVLAQTFSLFLDDLSPVSSGPCLSSLGRLSWRHLFTT